MNYTPTRQSGFSVTELHSRTKLTLILPVSMRLSPYSNRFELFPEGVHTGAMCTADCGEALARNLQMPFVRFFRVRSKMGVSFRLLLVSYTGTHSPLLWSISNL